MVTKIYNKLTQDQKKRGVMFSSTLSPDKSDDDISLTIHEVFLQQWVEDQQEAEETIQRLKNDSFFNMSDYGFNIIRE